MLNFFKRHSMPAESVSKAPSARPKERRSAVPNPLEPLPSPQVVEGNQDSDWAMWEDSVSFLDSQMPALEQDSVRVRQAQDPTPSPKGGAPTADPFASVGRRGS